MFLCQPQSCTCLDESVADFNYTDISCVIDNLSSVDKTYLVRFREWMSQLLLAEEGDGENC